MFGSSKDPRHEDGLTKLREAMGIMQHHDAITGTEKQHVANDYHRILFEAIEDCSRNTEYTLKLLSSGQNTVKDTTFDFRSCHNLNISQCDVSENSHQFIVTLYNPLAHSHSQHIRIPVNNSGDYYIRDHRALSVSFQVVPIPYSLQQLSYRNSSANYELVFLAENIPPLGFQSYYVAHSLSSNGLANADEIGFQDTEITIGNQYINLTFDANGHLASVFSNGVGGKLNQEFYYYESAVGVNGFKSSGAYLFRTNRPARVIPDTLMTEVIRGPVVDEFHQYYNEWLSQVVRVYKDENYAEFQWLVGPIPVEDKIGKEIIIRFSTDIQSNGTFETDGNGRETQYRIRNHRPTWNVDQGEPIAGNYYPINSKIAIEDDKCRLAILTDRPEGGSSVTDGNVELMVCNERIKNRCK